MLIDSLTSAANIKTICQNRPDEITCNATQVDYPEIAEGIFPRHRFMSAYEQKVLAPCYLFQSTYHVEM